jgi:outer membrane protein assembly factor BamD
MRRCSVVCWIALAACHHGGGASGVRPETEFARAREQFRRGDFARALVTLKRLSFEFGAAQPEAAEARYYLAECYFQTGDRVQAAHEFRQVADLYPNTDYAPNALLRAGDANLRMWRRPELDPSYGQTALAIYQEVRGRYPDTPAAARAQLHVTQLRDWFAEKTYKNGMFYFRRRAYDSGIIYFKDVIATYSDTHWTTPALLRLVDSYHAIGYVEERRETCAHLRRFYPTASGLAERCPADTSAASPS